MSQATDRESLFSVEDTVAVITGGGSGLGAQMALALDVSTVQFERGKCANRVKANGARAVYILGRRADSLQKTVDAAVNHKIVPIVADVTSQESLAAAAAEVRAAEGVVDVLIANSGIFGPTHYGLFPVSETSSISDIQSNLWNIPMGAWTQTMHVNVTGTFYTIVAFLDLLDAANHRSATSFPRPKSQVIVISSISGFIRLPGGSFSYGPSKAAATHMGKQLATSFAPYKIRFNTIAPGVVSQCQGSNIFVFMLIVIPVS